MKRQLLQNVCVSDEAAGDTLGIEMAKRYSQIAQKSRSVDVLVYHVYPLMH